MRLITVKVGDKIKFAGDKQRYTVQARDERFLICTRPFNLKATTLYTVVDLKEDVRGAENVVFGLGYETRQQCKEALDRFASGESEVSHRNRVPLDIAEPDPATTSLVDQLAGALEALVVLVEDQWVPERQGKLNATRAECEMLVRQSIGQVNPWCYTEETMRRREEELFGELRPILREANAVLDSTQRPADA